MFSEDAIDNLIQPIIDRQADWNTYVLKTIATRIHEIGSLTDVDLMKLNRLLIDGSDVRAINQMLAKLTRLQVADIKALIKTVAMDSYVDVKPFYDYRQKEFIPYENNVDIQRVTQAVANTTANTYTNIANSTGFMLRSEFNRDLLVPTSLSQTYQTVIDEAVEAVSLNVLPFEVAMRKTLRQLVNSGIRYITYDTESGRLYTQRLDTAVRRNILGGVQSVIQEIQNITGKEFGADGVELSAHINPAADHEEVQGHQFTNEQFDRMQNGLDIEDVDGNLYAGFDRPIGWWNCRHIAYSIIVGKKKQKYSNEKLRQIIEANNKGYTLPNGKHLTMYECTQEQRRMETEIRKAKDGQIMAREAGDRVLARYYQAKINDLTNDYNAFSDACGLPKYRRRMQVANYRKISVK